MTRQRANQYAWLASSLTWRTICAWSDITEQAHHAITTITARMNNIPYGDDHHPA